MDIHKRFIVGSLLLSFVFLGCLFALLYVYDPLQLYHKPYFREVAFSDDMRVQDKGIIKNYDFDSFILGTSMIMSTSAREADEKLGGKWVNVSLAGSHFNERAVILQYIFRQKSVARVIYSLDTAQLHEASMKETANWDFLYDNNEFNDIKIYINQKYILCALQFSSSTKCVGSKDLETLIYWATRVDEIIYFGGFNKWLENKKKIAVQEVIKKLREMQTISPFNTKPLTESVERQQRYIEKYLFSFIKEHPSTQFDFIIPPYSRLWYRLDNLEFPNSFSKIKILLKWFVQEVQTLPNAKIYGFDDLDYADDIANYSDLIHYNTDMNSMQLDAIANGAHILMPENIDEYLQTMENKIKAYDLAPLIQEIRDYEAKQK